MGRVGRLRVPDRRRRGASGRVRTALLDAVARTEGLGLTVVGVYDASIFASASSWVDARGATSGGPTITLTGSPTLSNGVYTFNGTDQYGRSAAAGRLGEFTAAGWVALIGTAPAADNTFGVDLGVGGTTRVLALRRAAGGSGFWTATGGTVSASAAVSARAIAFARRTASSGGNITVGASVNGGNEVTASGAIADATASRLTIGAGTSDVASGFAAFDVSLVVVGTGTLTSAARSIWRQYAALRGVASA